MLKREDITRERIQGGIDAWLGKAKLESVLLGLNPAKNPKSIAYVVESLESIIARLREKAGSFEALVVEYYCFPSTWIKPILMAGQLKYFGEIGNTPDYDIEDTAFLIYAKYLQSKLVTDYQIPWEPEFSGIKDMFEKLLQLPLFASLIESVDFKITGNRQLDQVFLKAAIEALRSAGEEGNSYIGGFFIEAYIAELCLGMARALKDSPVSDIKWQLLNVLADHQDDRPVHEPEYSLLCRLHAMIDTAIENYVLDRI